MIIAYVSDGAKLFYKGNLKLNQSLVTHYY